MQLADALEEGPVSYEEYLGWPETTAPIEFVDGHPIVSPTPTGPQVVAASRLARILGEAAPTGLEVIGASWDWVLRQQPLLVRQPDLMVVSGQQARRARLTEPPLLAAEVLSPTSIERDLVTKRREYAEAGLASYWIVSLDPSRILVLRNDGGTFTEHAAAKGSERLVVGEPFPVEMRPADLVP